MNKFEKALEKARRREAERLTPFAPPTPTPFDAPPEPEPPAPMTAAESACLTLGAVAFFVFFVGGAVVITSWFVMAVSNDNPAQFQMASRANLIAWPVCAVGWAMYRWLYAASCEGSDS